MNKKIIYSVVCAGCLALSTAVTVVSATTNNSSSSASKEASGRALIATTNELVPTNKFESKNETVYVITKASGDVTKSFVGSEINDSGEPLPVAMSVRYYLDGETISPEDLVGKSGHVRMVYRFESTKGSGDKVVPFVTVTVTVLLPADHVAALPLVTVVVPFLITTVASLSVAVAVITLVAEVVVVV